MHQVYALTFETHTINTSQDYSYGGIEYDADTGKITGIEGDRTVGLVVTLNLNALTEGDVTVVKTTSTGSGATYGFNTYSYTPEGAESSVIGLTGYWSGYADNNGRYSSYGEVTVDELGKAKTAGSDTTVDLYAFMSRDSGTHMLSGKDCASIYAVDGLRASGDEITGVYVNKDIVSSVRAGVTVSNADKSWSRTFGSNALVVSDGLLELSRSTSAEVSGKMGDIVVGGAGKLYLQTYPDGAISLNNDIYLGTSSFADSAAGGANIGLSLGAYSGNIDLFGNIYLVEDAAIWKEEGKGQNKTVTFWGNIDGSGHTLHSAGTWDNVVIQGNLDVQTWDLGAGSSITLNGRSNSIGELTTEGSSLGGRINVSTSGAVEMGKLSLHWGREINVDGQVTVSGESSVRNNSTISGSGQFYTEGLSAVNWSNSIFSIRKLMVGEDGFSLDQGSTVNLSTTILSEGRVTLNGILNIDGVGYMKPSENAYSDGENGFYTGNQYVAIQSENSITTGNAFAFKIDGVESDAYSITGNQMIVTYGETGNKGGFYYVNTTASATDAIAATTGFSSYFLAEKATLNLSTGDSLSADNAKAALLNAKGEGTICIQSETSILYRDTTINLQHAGTIQVESGAELLLGSSDNNDNKGARRASVAGTVKLNGGSMVFQGNRLDMAGLTSTNDSSTFNIHDMDGTARMVSIGVVDLQENLTITTKWKSSLTIDSLTGEGNLSASNESEASTMAIKALKDYGGTITVGDKVTASICVSEGQQLNTLNVTGSGKAVLSGSGTYKNGGNMALPTAVSLADDWSGTVAVTNATISDNRDLSALNSNAGSKVSISGLTVAEGGTLTLTGSGMLSGNVKFNGGELNLNDNIADFTTDVAHLQVVRGSSGHIKNGTIKLSTFDMRGGVEDPYGGTLELTNANLQINGAIWMHGENTQVLLHEDSSIKAGYAEISHTGADDSASIVSNGDGVEIVNFVEVNAVVISNANVAVTSTEAKTVNARLSNSSITNAGTGILTATHTANNLSGIDASKGKINLQNVDLDVQQELLSLSIAEGMGVAAHVGSQEFDSTEGRAKLTVASTGTATFANNSTLNADLEIKSGAKVTADGVLNLNSSTLTLGSNITLDGTLATKLIDLPADDKLALFSGITELNFTAAEGVTYNSSASVAYNAVDTTVDLADVFTVEGVNRGMYELTFSDGTLWASQMNIPEPATATLSLLALAGLCARRRRKS